MSQPFPTDEGIGPILDATTTCHCASLNLQKSFQPAKLSAAPGEQDGTEQEAVVPQGFSRLIIRGWSIGELKNSAETCELCRFVLRTMRKYHKLRTHIWKGMGAVVLEADNMDALPDTDSYTSANRLRLSIISIPKRDASGNIGSVADEGSISHTGNAAYLYAASASKDSAAHDSGAESTISNEIAEKDESRAPQVERSKTRLWLTKHAQRISKVMTSRSTPQASPSWKSYFPNSYPCSARGRKIGPKVDYDLLRAWLELCRSTHHRCAGDAMNRSMSEQLKSRMNVVDIKHSCVVRLPENCSYAALSYVWGEAERTEFGEQDWEALASPGRLQPVLALSPPVFRDALHVAERLGMRYIWIDALCIKQSDETDLLLQVSQMDEVYRNAEFTIVSTCADANKPLPGVKQASDRLQDSIVWNGVELICAKPSFAEALWRCPWESRGWTLQEKYFSRRLLIFNEHQVYWSCRRATWCEDAVLESTASEQQVQLAEAHSTLPQAVETYRPRRDLSPFETYKVLLRSFVRRSLSHESDALYAFAGIPNSLNWTLGGGFWSELWGIPLTDFDEIFLWTFDAHIPKSRRYGFPSWSWAGWAGGPEVQLRFMPLLASASTPRIRWFSWKDKIMINHAADEVIEGNVRLQEAASGTPDGSKLYLRGPRLSLSDQTKEKDESTELCRPAGTTCPSLFPNLPGPKAYPYWSNTPVAYVLGFWTELATLHVTRNDEPKYVPIGDYTDVADVTTKTYYILDYDRALIGSIRLNQAWRASRSDELHFIVVSAGPQLSAGSSYNIMLIEKDEFGIATRVQLASESVLTSVWQDTRPKREFIYLA